MDVAELSSCAKYDVRRAVVTIPVSRTCADQLMDAHHEMWVEGGS